MVVEADDVSIRACVRARHYHRLVTSLEINSNPCMEFGRSSAPGRRKMTEKGNSMHVFWVNA